MAWILTSLVLVTMMSSSAYECSKHGNSPAARRIEYTMSPTNEDQQTFERSNEDYEERNFERSIHRTSTNTRTPQRHKESARITSIKPFSSNRRGDNDNIPEECRKIGICESVPDYPVDLINDIINRYQNFKNKYHIDQLEAPNLDQRLGPQEDNLQLCSSREKVIYPEKATDKNGEWSTIINKKDNPLQGYRAEICDSPESACSDLASFNPGYKARCIQKFVYRTMVAVDAQMKPVEKSFKVPSCCSCVLKIVH